MFFSLSTLSSSQKWGAEWNGVAQAGSSNVRFPLARAGQRREKAGNTEDNKYHKAQSQKLELGQMLWLTPVILSYSGGRDQKDHGSKPRQTVHETLSQKKKKNPSRK
jgi:hypothetical protein